MARISVQDIFKPVVGLGLAGTLILMAACGTSRQLSEGKIKNRIQNLGVGRIESKAIRVGTITQSGENHAVAEAEFSTALQLSRTGKGDWQIDSIRLDDRNWVEVRTFLLALNEVRIRQTQDELKKLLRGAKDYRAQNGAYPKAKDIAGLTDALVPAYLSEVIRYDAWNRELILRQVTSDSLELVSLGPDGLLGTADDIVVKP